MVKRADELQNGYIGVHGGDLMSLDVLLLTYFLLTFDFCI